MKATEDKLREWLIDRYCDGQISEDRDECDHNHWFVIGASQIHFSELLEMAGIKPGNVKMEDGIYPEDTISALARASGIDKGVL